MSVRTERSDPTTERLAELFREHRAWRTAARHLSARANSAVYFSHRPGEPWRLEQGERGATRLLPGPADDPDLVFRFTPDSVERLGALEGDVGEFAVSLFSLVVDEDPEVQVGLRIAASFPRLVARGYLKLLLAAGPRVAAFGARHGVGDVRALGRFVRGLRARGPEAWETDRVR